MRRLEEDTPAPSVGEKGFLFELYIFIFTATSSLWYFSFFSLNFSDMMIMIMIVKKEALARGSEECLK